MLFFSFLFTKLDQMSRVGSRDRHAWWRSRIFLWNIASMFTESVTKSSAGFPYIEELALFTWDLVYHILCDTCNRRLYCERFFCFLTTVIFDAMIRNKFTSFTHSKKPSSTTTKTIGFPDWSFSCLEFWFDQKISKVLWTFVRHHWRFWKASSQSWVIINHYFMVFFDNWWDWRKSWMICYCECCFSIFMFDYFFECIFSLYFLYPVKSILYNFWVVVSREKVLS